MSLRERLTALFEPKEVKETREIAAQEAAHVEEGEATVAYLKGDMSLNEYRQTCDRLFPLTKLDLRRLAQDLKV